MIYPPFDSYAPGNLNCPEGTFDKNGFCFPVANVDPYYREIPLEPYTQQPISWYHNQNMRVSFRKVVNSLIYVDPDGVTSYFAPAGYQKDPMDEKLSNIVPSLFEDYFNSNNFPKLNYVGPADLSPIEYDSHVDPVIYPSGSSYVNFDPKLTYPEQRSPAPELCPKTIKVTYKASYGIWYGNHASLGVVEVIAHAYIVAPLLADHYTFEQIPEFFSNSFIASSGEGGLWYTVQNNSYCFYANGAFAFNATAFNVKDELVYPDPLLLDGIAETESDWDCSIPISTTDGFPSSNFIASGQECEIISITSESYRSLAEESVDAFVNGPALCGDYNSPTCWARHELELKIPVYSVNFEIKSVDDYLVVTNQLSLDSYEIRTQSFFRFCDNQFTNSSHRINSEFDNSWIQTLALHLPKEDPNWPFEVSTANLFFWDNTYRANKPNSLENIATVYMPLINNLNIPNDNIPIIGGVVTPEPKTDIISDHSFRYVYNAAPLDDCPNWPSQAGFTVRYDSSTVPGHNELIAGEPCGGS